MREREREEKKKREREEGGEREGVGELNDQSHAARRASDMA